MSKGYTVEKSILFYALRYAIGRKYTAPTIVIENIKENINNLSESDILMIIREIEETDNYGSLLDKSGWMEFLGYLKERV